MRSALGLVLIGVAVVVLIILSSATFVVLQTEQALVLRFGEPVAGRGLITDPGLHFKIPFVETVVLLDNRILDLESPKQEVLASDNQRIEVDAFVRYRIVDALRFFRSCPLLIAPVATGPTPPAEADVPFAMLAPCRAVTSRTPEATARRRSGRRPAARVPAR